MELASAYAHGAGMTRSVHEATLLACVEMALSALAVDLDVDLVTDACSSMPPSVDAASDMAKGCGGGVEVEVEVAEGGSTGRVSAAMLLAVLAPGLVGVSDGPRAAVAALAQLDLLLAKMSSDDTSSDGGGMAGSSARPRREDSAQTAPVCPPSSAAHAGLVSHAAASGAGVGACAPGVLAESPLRRRDDGAWTVAAVGGGGGEGGGARALCVDFASGLLRTPSGTVVELAAGGGGGGGDCDTSAGEYTGVVTAEVAARVARAALLRVAAVNAWLQREGDAATAPGDEVPRGGDADVEAAKVEEAEACGEAARALHAVRTLGVRLGMVSARRAALREAEAAWQAEIEWIDSELGMDGVGGEEGVAEVGEVGEMAAVAADVGAVADAEVTAYYLEAEASARVLSGLLSRWQREAATAATRLDHSNKPNAPRTPAAAAAAERCAARMRTLCALGVHASAIMDECTLVESLAPPGPLAALRAGVQSRAVELIAATSAAGAPPTRSHGGGGGGGGGGGLDVASGKGGGVADASEVAALRVLVPVAAPPPSLAASLPRHAAARHRPRPAPFAAPPAAMVTRDGDDGTCVNEGTKAVPMAVPMAEEAAGAEGSTDGELGGSCDPRSTRPLASDASDASDASASAGSDTRASASSPTPSSDSSVISLDLRTREMLPGIMMASAIPRSVHPHHTAGAIGSAPKTPPSAARANGGMRGGRATPPSISVASPPAPVEWPLATLSLLSPPPSPTR